MGVFILFCFVLVKNLVIIVKSYLLQGKEKNEAVWGQTPKFKHLIKITGVYVILCGTGPQHSLAANLDLSFPSGPWGGRLFCKPSVSLGLSLFPRSPPRWPAPPGTGLTSHGRRRQTGSGPRPHSHLPLCSFSVDIILFGDLAFTLKSHHCHQGRNVIIFSLSKCDSWCHFPSCVALFSANSYVSVCILLGRKHQTQNGSRSCGSLWVFQGIW